MNTKTRQKKGFTIVELVIVIAVIAILAAVLIPTFASLVKKANLSADQVAVRNMNTALSTYEVEYGKPNDPHDVNEAFEKYGYNADNTPLTKGYSFVWNKEANVIMLLDENNAVIFPEEYKDVTYDSLKHFDLSYPVAQVEENGAATVNVTGGKLDLDCSFAFVGDAEDAATSEYKDWAVDFVVYFDKDVTVTAAGQTLLAGQYDENSTDWVPLDLFYLNDLQNTSAPVTITAGTKYDLLQDIVVGKIYTQYQGLENILWDYEGICDSVGTFKCGAYDNGTNAGTTMTVELRMYETITTNVQDEDGSYTSTTTRNEDNYIVVYVYEYTF